MEDTDPPSQPVPSATAGNEPTESHTGGSPSQDAITVLLLDNRTVMREALACLVDQQCGFRVVGQASDPQQAIRLGLRPDVIVTEIDLAGTETGDVIPLVKAAFPHGAVLVLTNVDHPAKVHAALTGGAAGFVLKTSTREELFFGIRTVARGETYLQPSLGVELARWHGPRHALRLSPKEEEVLALIAAGHTNAEIARRLAVSLRTAETHRARVMQKLGLRTRAELFEYALHAGLIAGH